MVEKTKEKSTEKVHFIVRELFITKRIKRVVQALDIQKARNKMNDLISRQAAINAADIADCTGLAIEDVKKVTDEVVKEIRKLPPAQQWIQCSERLPEEDMRIIVQYGDGSFGVIEHVRLKIWNLINSPYAKVVAWMQMP